MVLYLWAGVVLDYWFLICKPIFRHNYIHLIRWFSIIKYLVLYFASWVVFFRTAQVRQKYKRAKCPLVLYAKPLNKRFIIPLQKIDILQLASIFLVRVFRNVLTDSFCENDVNNEQNLCAYYMPNHWMRG